MVLKASVIRIHNSRIIDSELVMGTDREEVHQEVRRIFVNMMSEEFTNFDEYSSADIDLLLDECGEHSIRGDSGVYIEWFPENKFHMVK